MGGCVLCSGVMPAAAVIAVAVCRKSHELKPTTTQRKKETHRKEATKKTKQKQPTNYCNTSTSPFSNQLFGKTSHDRKGIITYANL